MADPHRHPLRLRLVYSDAHITPDQAKAEIIIESPGFVDRFGINMVEGVTLPDACAATCNVSVSVQRMG